MRIVIIAKVDVREIFFKILIDLYKINYLNCRLIFNFKY